MEPPQAFQRSPVAWIIPLFVVAMEPVRYGRKPASFSIAPRAAVLPMKHSYGFRPAALLAASLPRALLLFSALLATPAAPASAGEAQRRSADLTPAAGRKSPELSAVAALGRKMFFDPSLSGSGQLSCASCHSPANAYGPPNDPAVQPAGRDLRQPGLRAAPSLTYISSTPLFTIGPGSNSADDDGPRGARV